MRMRDSFYPQNENLYRLPWSVNDSPIGWIEITDTCNIKCEGCYRLMMGEGHKSLAQIKEEILFLKKWRNCDGISISGGESILHPDILKIVRFIKINKMKSIILTNGYALTESFLRDLKAAGLTGVSLHIDSTQSRPEMSHAIIKSESELDNLRLKYATIISKVGLYAHFGITVSDKNLHDVPGFIQWAIHNMKLINGISLIIFRGMYLNNAVEFYADGKKVPINANSLGYVVQSEEKPKKITSKDVYALIKKAIPNYEATSYLGGTEDHTSLKWLIGNIIVNSKGISFGSYGKKTIEIAQIMHHLNSGSYLTYPRRRIGRKIFLMSPFDKTLRKALFKYLMYLLMNPIRLFYAVNTLGIGIVQAPDLLPDGRIDMCDDCPDMCVYDGKLVNSCRLDEYRKFGSLLRAHIKKEEESFNDSSA